MRARLTGERLLGLALATGFALLAFTTSGEQLQPDTADTVAQILLVALAAGLGVALLLGRGRGGRAGAGALGWFAGLSALTFASIAWSVQPAYSWLEANVTLSYLAAFAAAMALARLSPGSWRALLVGVALSALVVCGYALVSKVFPGSLDAGDQFGRLRTPFGYYNATGLAAGLGLPAWLWLAGARGARQPARGILTVLGVPALATLVCALVLSYSRGALLAAVIGLAVWVALSPARLGGLLLLAAGAAGGAAVSVWASAQPALMRDYQGLAARTTDGHHFGVVLLIALVALLAAGAAILSLSRRVTLSAGTVRRIQLGLLAGLALVPVLVVVALAASSRGLTGEVWHLVSTLTNPNGGAGDQPGRLAQLGSSRPRYWRDGLRVGAHAPLAGTGAFGFWIAHKRYSPDHVLEAHSYVVQTFADLGALGLAASLGLLIAWALAVRRTLGGWRARGTPADERSGRVVLLAIAVTFGVHSTIDWTWFLPGVAVPALACAGWLAGRGASVPGAGGPVATRGRVSGARLAGAGAAGLATLVVAYMIWQPLRSFDAVSAALAAQNPGQALTDARTAANVNPLDYVPLQTEAAIEAAIGDLAAARRDLVQATARQPENPETWYALAQFDTAHGRPAAARRELARARQLDPFVSTAE